MVGQKCAMKNWVIIILNTFKRSSIDCGVAVHGRRWLIDSPNTKNVFYLSFNVLSSSSPPRTRIPREFNLCNANTAKSLVISFVYSAIQSPYQSSALFFSYCCHPWFSSFTKMSSILSQKSRQSNNTARARSIMDRVIGGELCNNFSFLLRPEEEAESCDW